MGVVAKAQEEAAPSAEVIVRQVLDTPPQGSFRFTKKITLRQYEPVEASVTIPFTVNPDDDDEIIQKRGAAAALVAKALVFSELGVDMKLEEGEAGTILTEVVRQGFPGSEAVASSPQSAEASVGSSPPHEPKMVGTDKVKRAENRKWAEARYQSHPGEFLDNRADKAKPDGNPKWPDFKHLASGIGIWLD